MLLSLDIETTGLDYFKDRILCIGIFSPETGYQVFSTIEEFNRWNNPLEFQFVCHNGTFDVSFLRHHGADIRSQFLYDTRSMATALIPIPPIAKGQSRAYALENLYITLLKGAVYKEDRTKMESLSWEALTSYNKKDCRITYDLCAYLCCQFDEKDWKFILEWLMPATKLTMEMSYNGVLIDQPRLEACRKETEEKLDAVKLELRILSKGPQLLFEELEREKLQKTYDQMAIRALVKARDKEACRKRYEVLRAKAERKIAPFNFASPLQLKWLLKDFYGLDLFNKRSQKETTDEAMLKEHASKHPICEVLCRYRETEKMATTCIPALLDHLAPDGRIHARFIVGGTRTGRLSSSNPNIQQIPKGVLRSCIVSSPGSSFFIADYAQIEVRILAELAKEKELIDAFKEEIDCYSIIAKKLLQLGCPVSELKKLHPRERNVSKTAGLSIFYGTGAGKLREVLSKELGIEKSIGSCRDFIQNYRDSFPAIKAYKEKLERDLANQEKIHGLLGRPVYIHDNDDRYMKGMNTVVQGSASDLVVMAFLKICAFFPYVRPVMLIHDEMVFEIPDDCITPVVTQTIEEIATRRMEEELKLSVPLKIEWQIAKEWMKP